MSDQTSREELLKLREEIERELGIKFTTDEKEFDLDEDLVIHQVRSSIAGHGSGAHHSYLKQAKIEDIRLTKMKEEWDRAVYRLEKHKELRERDAQDQELREKSVQKRKKSKANKKKNKSSDSDDDDIVSLFVNPSIDVAEVQLQQIDNKLDRDTDEPSILAKKRKAEDQIEHIDHQTENTDLKTSSNQL